MIKIVVSGCCGKMGKRIIALAKEDKFVKLTGAVEAEKYPDLGKDIGDVLGVGTMDVKIISDLEQALKGADCLIEFTTPLATVDHLTSCVKHKKAVIIGTTGITKGEEAKIKEASQAIPIVYSPNMSIGVNVLFGIVGEVARKLGENYQVEITEAHHKHKKDAPSGTALKLAQMIAQAKGLDLQKAAVYGREGKGLTRPDNQIGIHAVRAGDVVGEHNVMYCGTGERIEIIHRAGSRDTFAAGALRAARFIAGKTPGLYSMRDVLEGL